MLAAATATGLEQTTAVVASILAGGLLCAVAVMVVRWKRARHAEDRAEAIRLTLGRTGASFFYLFVGVGVVVMVSLGIAVAGQQSR